MSSDKTKLRAFTKDDLGWLVQVHGEIYARDEGFDESFGVLVEQILKDFLRDCDPTCEHGWVAEQEGIPLGSIFCVRGDVQGYAKLRLFMLLPEARGLGLGRRMLDTCMGFARDKGYHGMRLWTHESHAAACALYAANGWSLTASKPVTSFGVDLVEQTWEIAF
ncbi:GNAT family N-acetyltransferase [Shimia sp.]|uniref:GNAT family N-acetyltransferase n=1 Tax=Shimia sp. TaxID=1954381 RepID=UPI0032970CF1